MDDLFSPPDPRLRGDRKASRPGARVTVAVLAVLCTLAAGCSAAPEEPDPVEHVVVHDGKRTTVSVPPDSSVDEVVEHATLGTTEGQVRSVKTKAPLGANGNQATYEVDGQPVDGHEVLPDPTTVTVVDGADTIEATKVEQRPLDPEGLPDALQYVQFAGRPGVEEVTVGVQSGEVVAQRTITPAVPAHRATGKVLALTFDDGPSPTFTEQVLKILKSKHVPATFCVVGTQVQDRPELAQQIVDGGHQLCNHTLHHVEGLEDEPVLYWSIDPRDWQKPPANEIVASVVGQLVPGGIILLHDGGGNRDQTVEALPAIIDYARALGYTFTAPISLRPQVG